MTQSSEYGVGDNSFQAAGGETGICNLVDSFYDIMSSEPDYQKIRSWHKADDFTMRDKLTLFLCGWLGGPRLYNIKYGPINIPSVHEHLNVTEKERDQWLSCMSKAIAKQDYPQKFAEYLIEQLAIPAERIRVACNQKQL